MLSRLANWIVGREPVAAATGVAAVVTALAGVLTAFDVVVLSGEQIAALGALAAAVAGLVGRRAVTPVHVPRTPPEAGGVPLALLILIALAAVLLAGLGLCGDALFEDEDEVNDLGAPALVLDHDGDYYGDEYDQDYSSRDRNRNRGRNRGAFSPGPFEDSPVDFRDNCISLDCGGRERSEEQR